MSTYTDPLIQKLVAKLKHHDPIARRNAAAALRLHGVRAVGAAAELRRLLDDEDLRVREEARRALERLTTAAA